MKDALAKEFVGLLENSIEIDGEKDYLVGEAAAEDITGMAD